VGSASEHYTIRWLSHYTKTHHYRFYYYYCCYYYHPYCINECADCQPQSKHTKSFNDPFHKPSNDHCTNYRFWS
jgi:hypothetical protein